MNQTFTLFVSTSCLQFSRRNPFTDTGFTRAEKSNVLSSLTPTMRAENYPSSNVIAVEMLPESRGTFIKKVHKRMLNYISIMLLVLLSTMSWGQVSLPHYEGFNYTVGQSLVTQSGWTLLNSPTTDMLVTSGSLSSANTPISIGNKVNFLSAGEDATKLFAQQTSGTVYFSFLMRINALGGLNATGGYFAGLTEGATTSFGCTIWTRLNGSNYDIGVSPRTAAPASWSLNYSVGSTVLVVASYQLVSGANNDIVKIWINPLTGGSEPAPNFSVTNSGTDLANLNRFLLRQADAGGTPDIDLDELRIGTTWASVSPTPTITTTSISSNVNASYGNTAIFKIFDVGGSNLTAGITIKPPVGFEVSNSINFTGTPGTNANPFVLTGGATISPTHIYIRLIPTGTPGTYSGNVECTSPGAAQADVATVASTLSKATTVLTVTGSNSFVFNSNPQGPDTYTLPAVGVGVAPTGTATFTYVGTGATAYPSSSIKPTDPGTYNASADYPGDVNYHPVTSSPFSFSITSSGIPSLSVSGPVSGDACIGSPTTVQWTITNSGTAQADGIQVSSTNSQFTPINLQSTSIAAGSSIHFDLRFIPTSSGTQTTDISVTSSTSGSNSPSVSTSGSGISSINQSVSTDAVASVTNNSATLRGTVTTLGVCPATTEKGFVYSITSLNSDPLVGGSDVTTVSFTTPSTGTYLSTPFLISGTGYTYKAYVYNGSTYTYGSPVSFSTYANADHLALVGVTSSGSVGANFATFTVEARRPDNSVDVFYPTSTITIQKVSGSGTLSGTTSSASNGVATFSSLQFSAADVYTIKATASGLTDSPNSGNITITLTNATAILYSNSSSGTWMTAGNWTGSVIPNGTQVAQFGLNPSSNSAIGLNLNNSFPLGTGNYDVGAIEVTPARASVITLGNSSTSVSGFLTLNGAVVNGVQHTVLRNSSNHLFTVQNFSNSNTTRTMQVVLNDATDNIVNVEGTGGITISSIVSGAGKKLTLNGTGTLTLSGNNTYDGGTVVNSGTIYVTNPTSLGTGTLTMNGGVHSVGGSFINSRTCTCPPGYHVNVAPTFTYTHTGTFSCGGDFVKTGDGIYEMQTTSPIAGTLLLQGGTLRTSVVNALSPNNKIYMFGGSMRVSADLTVSSITISSGSLILDDNVVLTVTEGIYYNGGSVSIGNNARIVYGPSATLSYSGSAPQTTSDAEFPPVSGPSSVTINNPAGVTLHASRSVGSLTLAAGVLNAGPTYTFKVTDANGVTRIGGHVAGRLQKTISSSGPVTFEVGDASVYRPVVTDLHGLTLIGDLTVSVSQADGAHPGASGSGLNPSKTLDRYFTLENSGLGFTDYDATFTFDASDVPSSANPSNFIVSKLSAGVWSKPTVQSTTTTTIQIVNVTSFSDFLIGEPCIAIAGETAGSNSPVCENGLINLSSGVTAGEAPISYSWTGPNGFTSSLQNPSIPSASLAAGGTYTVTISNACGSTTAQTTVVVNAKPVVVPAVTNVSCPGTVNGSVSVSVSGGSTPYSYVWSNGETTSSSGFVAAGTYTVTVTDNNSCSSVSSSTVGTNGTTPSITTQDIAAACGQSTVDLNDGVVTYSNTNGEVIDFSDDNFSSNLPSSIVNTAGVYQARVTNNAGCVASGTITVTFPSVSSVPTVTAPVCASSTEIEGTSVEADGTVITLYSNNNPLGTAFVSGQAYLFTLTVPLLGGEQLTATATASGACESAASSAVTVNDAKSAGTVSPQGNIMCSGTDHLYTSSGDAGGSWSTSNPLYVSVDNTGTVHAVAPGTANVIYEVTDACGVTDQASAAVTVTAPPTWYADADADGFGDNGDTQEACVQPSGYIAQDGDCDDSEPSVNPDGVEVCNGIDDDCSLSPDDNIPVSNFYPDVDEDNYGDATATPVPFACPDPGYLTDHTDCDDGDPLINPGVAEIPGNNIDDNCDGGIDNTGIDWYADTDADGFGDPAVVLNQTTQPPGYVADNSDCDDTNPDINPDATEICNSIDDNCDGTIDNVTPEIWYVDVDADTYGDPASAVLLACNIPSNYVQENTDCDDGDPTIHPGATETCNSLDDDCDGTADEGVLLTWYQDNDGDTYGNPAMSQLSCFQPFSYVADNTDCNDNDIDISPAGTEVCNLLDDDCNGTIDDVAPELYYVDVDQDGFGDPASGIQVTCTVPPGYVADNTDCDDGDPTIYPGATELCNGMDDDCDGLTDEGMLTTWFADADGDTYGNHAVSQVACVAPFGYVADDNDCDDTDDQVNPAATEICNSIDDDCNGQVDDIIAELYYADVDQDGFGDPASGVFLTCNVPPIYIQDNTDCDDGDPTIYPGATEICNQMDDDCDGLSDEGVQITWYRDLDSDTYGDPFTTQLSCTIPFGYVADNSDCNDNDASINPDGVEVCNGQDDDCDGTIDDVQPETYYADVDNDSYGDPATGIPVLCVIPANYVLDNTDCDDGDPLIHPGATEICNGFDDDCDGLSDEGVLITWYRDFDADTYGDPFTSQQACTTPFGYVADNSDCDDNNAAVNPAATEVCNGIDDDCNGNTDDVPPVTYYADVDNDSYGDPASGIPVLCVVPPGYVLDNTDCDDGDPAVHPGATEICNLVDDDCDGSIDEGVQLTWYRDFDADTYGDPAVTQLACTAPFGFVADNSDCNDNNAAVNPAATEVCNGLDDNCDGTVDNAAPVTYYADVDQDGYGDPSSGIPVICTVPPNYVSDNTDCDDGDPTINPGATEICNQVDDDCDGTIDEGAPLPVALCKNITVYLDATGNASITPAMVDNGSSAACGIFTSSIDISSFTCANTGANNVTLTIEDLNHQVATCVAVVTVSDTIRPVFSGCPSSFTATITCAGQVSWTAPTASDNCAIASVTSSHNPGDVFPAGNTTVTYTATDVNGNSSVCSFVVTIVPFTISTSGTSVSCVDGSNGSASVSTFNTQGAVTYLWSNGETTASITGLTAGVYTITVTNGLCVQTETYTVNTPTAITPTAVVTNVGCFGASTGSINLTVTGGTPGYTFLWNSGATTEDRSGLAQGTYTVTITDAAGCTISSFYTVTQPVAPLGVTTSVLNANCNGAANGAASANPVSGTSPYTYLWSNGQTTQTITGLSAGTYTVTVTDFNGCTAANMAVVNQPLPLSINPTVNNALCFNGNGSITTAVSGGTGSYTYLWSTGATTASLTAPAGTYTVTVTSAPGCSVSGTYTIGQPATAVTVSLVSQTNIVCNGASTGAAVVSASGGTGTISYLWSNGQTTSSLSNVAAGTYTVTASDGNGCTASMSVTITQAPAFVASVDIVHVVTCTGGSDGELQANVSGATPGYTYLWNTGVTTVNITGLTAGTYTVTITDAAGCTAVRSATLTPIPLTATLTAVPVNCFGASTGSVSTVITSGVPSYNYLWSTGATSSSISGQPAGTYTVTITDSRGCTAIYAATITQSPLLVITPTVTHITCNNLNNGSISTSVNGGSPGYTYLWNTGATTSSLSSLAGGNYTVTVTDTKGCTQVSTSTVVNPAVFTMTASRTNVTCNGAANGTATSNPAGGTAPYSFLWSTGATTQTIINLGPGIYTVTATDLHNCATVTRTVIVTQPAAITLALNSQTNVVCGGSATGSATVTASGGVSPYTYVWSNGQTGQTATGLAAGTYTVTATASNGCTGTRLVTITENPAVIATANGTNVLCNGFATGTAAVSASGGVGTLTYLWSTGSTSNSISGLVAGTYTVTVSDVNGCTAVASYTVTEPVALAASVVNTAVNCNGGSTGALDLTVTGGTPVYSYVWSNGSITEDISGLMAGTYTVTITDANSCVLVQSYTVSESAPISISGTASNSTCITPYSGAVDISVSGGTPGYTYLWSNAATTEDISGIAPGTYTVTVTDAFGCTAVEAFTVSPNVISLSAVQSNVLCRNQSNGSVALTPSGGISPYTYVWSNGQTTSTLTGVPAGNYTVTVTDAGGCTASSTYTITQPAAVLGVGTVVVNANCNGAANGSITANPAGGTSPYTYLWSNGQTTKTITGLLAGPYTVTVTDFNGCTSFTTAVVSQPLTLSINPTVNNALCFGGSGSITTSASGGTGGYTYLWSTGATTSSISALAGTYTLTVTSAPGCTVSGTYTIGQPSTAVSVSLVSQTNIICSGASTGGAVITAGGGTGTLTYLWSNGQTSANLINATAGTYTLTVTDANGCTANLAVNITEPPAFVVSVNTLHTVTCTGGNDGELQVNVSGATPGYTYLWNTGATTSNISSLTAGTYTVTITDAAGCTTVSSATLAVPTALTATVSTVPVNCFGAATGSASVTVTSGVPSYSYLWSGGQTTSSITGQAAGTYTVTITDSRGCTAVYAATITEATQIVISATVNNITCNNLNNGSITTSVNGGTPGYTYLWNTGATTSGISSLAGGNYTLTVTDTKGCTRVGNYTVVNPAVFTMTASRTNVTCNGAANGTATSNTAGGTAPYSYLWNTGATTQTITNLGPGTYTVTATDLNHCATITRTVIVTQPAAITMALNSQTNVVCGGTATGSATVTASGGVSPYTYAWSNGQTGQTATGLAAGTYTVTATASNGCTGIRVIVITENTPLTVTLNTSGVNCNDGSITAVPAGSSGPYTYLWNTGATTATVNGLSAGTYTVTVTSSTGCTKVGSATLSQVNPVVISSISPASGNVGTVVTINGSGFTGATAVRFTGADAVSFTVVSDIQIDATVPAGTLSGPVKVVRAACDSATSGQSFLMPTITLNLKVYLEGLYTGSGLMTPALLNQGVAGATATQADSITVELRASSSPYAAVYVSSSIVLSTNGTAMIGLPAGLSGSSLYIVVKNRNHITTWSKFPVTFGGTTTYDFTTP